MSPSFDRVRSNGRRFSSFSVNCYVLSNGTGVNRLAMRVAKRLVRLSVHRNEVKRVLRESFRSEDLGTQGVDVLMVYRSKGACSRSPLRQELKTIWGQVKQSCGS